MSAGTDTVSGPAQASPEAQGTPAAAAARMPWLRFAATRLGRFVVSLWVLITATFFMIHLVPGNPVAAALGQQATAQLIKLREQQLGLTLPLPTQYWDYVRGVFSGNFGSSIITSEPVSTLLADRFPNTLALALPAFVLVILIAAPVGLLVAVRTGGGRGRRTRGVFVAVTSVLNSIPDYILGTLLTVVFVITIAVFPASGNATLSSYVLPVIALIAAPTASLSRIVRVEAIKVLDAEYIRAARARRLPWRILYLKHVLPNMLTASLTFSGMILAGLIGGTVLVENIFNWPGVGTLITQAVIQKDYPLVQGVLLVLGAIVLVINMIIDLALGALDPRSRIGGQ